MGKKEHCSYCCQHYRKQNKSWGAKRVVEVPGCKDCHLRYKTDLRERSAKFTQLEAKVARLEAEQKQQTASKVGPEVKRLKAAHEGEKRKSTFLKISRARLPGDVLLSVQGMEVPAHRLILADKSQVFEKMFEGGMAEKSTGVILIEDTSYPVMEAVVNFCYTAEISFSEEVPPEEVIAIAHKLKFDHLRAVCEAELCGTITVNNLPQILKLAHTCEAKMLQAEVAKFFKLNFHLLQDSLFHILGGTVPD